MKYINRIATIASSFKAKNKIDVQLNGYGMVEILAREMPKYNPEYVPTLYEILTDEDCNKKIVIGPYNSGKTSGLVNQIVLDSMMMPACDDGIRKSRWAVIRNTSGQLETTTLNTWNYWTEGLPHPKKRSKPNLIFEYRFNDPYGEIWMDIIFLPLDRLDDIRKLDSLELTGAYFNELRHIPKGIFDIIQSRMPRYPAKIEFLQQFEDDHKHLSAKEKQKIFSNWKPYQEKLYADTNPPKVRHWIQEIDDNPTPTIKVYHQPPALLKNEKGIYEINELADNLLFAGKSYYLDMIPRGEEFIKVYAQGKYGTIVDGKPVYPNYNDDLHSVDDIPINIYEPLYLGWDFGTVSPACIIKQIVGGPIRAIKDFVVDCETVEAICKNYLIPFLNTYCKGMTLISTHDPANTSEGAQQLQKFGIESKGCRTNYVEPRIAAVASNLDRLKNGKPAYIVSRKGCPVLREGFLGEYHYRKLKVVGVDERFVDLPNKVHPYSDIHDANQYVDMLICDEEGINSFNKTIPYDYNQVYNEETKSKITGY